MKEQIIKNGQGQEVQVLSDGRTVWVNGHHGALIGRFGPLGIDIHADPGADEHCLDCRPTVPNHHHLSPQYPSWANWKDFVKGMKEHHGVDMPDGNGLINEWLENMIDVPKGCRERLEFIEKRADELDHTFHNGNRKDLLAALEELPPRVAFAVLATIMADSPEGESLKRFLQEMA